MGYSLQGQPNCEIAKQIVVGRTRNSTTDTAANAARRVKGEDGTSELLHGLSPSSVPLRVRGSCILRAWRGVILPASLASPQPGIRGDQQRAIQAPSALRGSREGSPRWTWTAPLLGSTVRDWQTEPLWLWRSGLQGGACLQGRCEHPRSQTLPRP
ncbi:hypothetical protein BD289DRAFT_119972 [Coniella lustricola]|uniref:Uncharacterized protein n=1 Tax=Coniella lustricola TaxID=2025994 RepID=A0A2T3AG48_9PEZI|nr:hypothetical protein BD289DRAFT_119972 [Coniella lustricola]